MEFSEIIYFAHLLVLPRTLEILFEETSSVKLGVALPL